MVFGRLRDDVLHTDLVQLELVLDELELFLLGVDHLLGWLNNVSFIKGIVLRLVMLIEIIHILIPTII